MRSRAAEPAAVPVDPRADPTPAATTFGTAPGTAPAESERPRRSSLSLRIVLLVLGVAVAVAGIAGVVGTAMIRTVAVDVTRNYLADQADVLAGQLAGEQPARLGLARLTPLLARQGITVVNVARTGVTGANARAVRAATAAGVPGLTDGKRLSATVPIDGRSVLVEGRSVNGRAFALVSTVENGPAAAQQSLQRRVLLALAIGVAAAVLGGLLVGALISRPLRRTAALARAMGAGARDVRAAVAGPREVAEVATAVNELAAALAFSEGRQREFLTSVSHELRTPLAAISGQAQALADGIVPGAEVEAVGGTITAEAARLERLVSDLLDLARLGADSFRVELAPCDLTALVTEMAAVWQVRCRPRGVPLIVEVPPGPVPVATDARRLRQVLDGLAENALRLLQPGAPLVFSLRAGYSGVSLAIRDAGPGLTEQDYPVAFERGVLHERYRGRRPGGAGLGLALARSLVTRLGGHIWAGPAGEGGVSMTVELPYRPDPPTSSPAPTSSPTPTSSPALASSAPLASSPPPSPATAPVPSSRTPPSRRPRRERR